jgi:gamma-tubulin complex component 2
LTHFLDLAHGELRKSGRSASLVKLQSLLDLALTTDAQGEDALYREDVRVGMSPHGLYDWLLKVVSLSGEIGDGDAAGAAREASGEDSKKQILGMPHLLPPFLYRSLITNDSAIDALVLDYTVPFPLSLVISRKTILRYQLLFRFLLHLKHAEQSLGAMWVEQKAGPWRAQAPPGSNGEAFGAWRARVLLLRTRMLAFVQQVLAFAAIEVLEPNWRRLEEKLAQVRTVDQLLRDHVDFLDTCLKECMLTSSKLLKVCCVYPL